MFARITLTLVTIILLSSVAGCGTTNQPSQDTANPQDDSASTITDTESSDNYQMLPIISGSAADLKLDANSDGTTQQLNIGQVLSVSLESNPSTGYSWFGKSSDPAILVVMGEPEYQAAEESATPMVGAPGTTTIFFQAVEKGTATITLDYVRSWETDVAPEKTISITVEVK